MLAELLLLLIAVVSIVYWFYKWATVNNKYFEKRNMKYIKPTFLVGNTAALFTTKYTKIEFATKLYNAFPNESIYGLFDFRLPQFIIRDPEAIKKIAVKDFDHFEDHRGYTDEPTDPLWSNCLFFMKGEKWRQMRATLSPAFTGSKMRQMFELVSDCANDVVNLFLAKAKAGEVIDIEMKDFFSRYTNDVIASCAFGLKVNSFTNPENDFFVSGKKMMNFTGFKKLLQLFVINKLPWIVRLFKLQLSEMQTSKLFKSIILDTMEMRKNQNIYRPDMINIMMQVRDGNLKHQMDDKIKNERDGFATVEESDVGKASVTRKWNDDEIVAQCFLFFVAGFDTSSTLLTLVSYELIANPDVQQKLYEEISNTNAEIGEKSITYDVLQKMKYMDQMICETLRKWPPAVHVDRICVKDYVYDDGNKYKFNVEKGIPILFPIYGIHHDERYFPNPERFDPERFNDENKDSIIPGAYIPFGVGPRNCIGSRFALMELKAILYYMLLNFSFESNAKTQIPIKFVKSAFSLHTESGMHLRLKLRIDNK